MVVEGVVGGVGLLGRFGDWGFGGFGGGWWLLLVCEGVGGLLGVVEVVGRLVGGEGGGGVFGRLVVVGGFEGWGRLGGRSRSLGGKLFEVVVGGFGRGVGSWSEVE